MFRAFSYKIFIYRYSHGVDFVEIENRIPSQSLLCEKHEIPINLQIAEDPNQSLLQNVYSYDYLLLKFFLCFTTYRNVIFTQDPQWFTDNSSTFFRFRQAVADSTLGGQSLQITFWGPLTLKFQDSRTQDSMALLT